MVFAKKKKSTTETSHYFGTKRRFNACVQTSIIGVCVIFYGLFNRFKIINMDSIPTDLHTKQIKISYPRISFYYIINVGIAVIGVFFFFSSLSNFLYYYCLCGTYDRHVGGFGNPIYSVINLREEAIKPKTNLPYRLFTVLSPTIL